MPNTQPVRSDTNVTDTARKSRSDRTLEEARVEEVTLEEGTADAGVSDTISGLVVERVPTAVVDGKGWEEAVPPPPDEHPTTALANITTAKDARASMSHRN